MFQEGNDGKQPWENQDTDEGASQQATAGTETTEEDSEWRVLKDNKPWQKQDMEKEKNQDMAYKAEATADGTAEKGLGPTDTLVQTGNPYGFQPLTMKILRKDKDKGDWQDKDPDIRIVKCWLKEGQQPTGKEMNYKTPKVQAYRKALSVLRLKQVEEQQKPY